MPIKREHGQEHPYIPLSIFKLRLPWIHFGWAWPEALQGLFLVAVPLGAIPVHQDLLGVSFEVGLTMVALNGLLYVLHPLFGDPLFPGWITPVIPLVLTWGMAFPAGIERIHAVIALQLTMAVMFLFMGLTGLARKIVSYVPLSVRAGIILGAGIAATLSVVQPGGRMQGMEWTIIIGTLISYLILFSWRFQVARTRSVFAAQLAKYGMLPGVVVAAIIGPILGEIPAPVVEWGIIPLHFGELIQGYTIFGVGFPPLSAFLSALPLVFAAYIIAFGDFVLAEVVTKDTDNYRDDESIDFNANRSNAISGLRNLIMGLVAPYGPLNGPLWAGGTIAIAERYKQGRQAMDTIYSGTFAFIFTMWLGSLLLPVVSLARPVLPAGLSLTLTVQGFACSYIAMDMLKTREERGVAGIMAILLASRGATWGLASGFLLHYIIGVKPNPNSESILNKEAKS